MFPLPRAGFRRAPIPKMASNLRSAPPYSDVFPLLSIGPKRFTYVVSKNAYLPSLWSQCFLARYPLTKVRLMPIQRAAPCDYIQRLVHEAWSLDPFHCDNIATLVSRTAELKLYKREKGTPQADTTFCVLPYGEPQGNRTSMFARGKQWADPLGT